MGSDMRLSLVEAEQRIKSLPGWRLEATKSESSTYSRISRRYRVRQPDRAGGGSRRPSSDILVTYKRVTLTYSTHSEGGLTEKDFAGAAWPNGSRRI